MNLIQVPATLMLLSTGAAQKNIAPTAKQSSLVGHILHALRQPVVWAPMLALVLILFNLHRPATCLRATPRRTTICHSRAAR